VNFELLHLLGYFWSSSISISIVLIEVCSHTHPNDSARLPSLCSVQTVQTYTVGPVLIVRI